jgi:hypothetical protein
VASSRRALGTRWAGVLPGEERLNARNVVLDDAPGLTDALVALNWIGFWTRTSQASADGEGYDGELWTQLAAVGGFADPATVERLKDALAGTLYRIQALPARQQGHDAVVVTRGEGQAYTGSAEGWTTKTPLSRSPALVSERPGRCTPVPRLSSDGPSHMHRVVS